MFVEELIQMGYDPYCTYQLYLIKSQLNLLLCLVNDVRDIKLIESGKFSPKMEAFSPLETLQLIREIF